SRGPERPSRGRLLVPSADQQVLERAGGFACRKVATASPERADFRQTPVSWHRTNRSPVAQELQSHLHRSHRAIGTSPSQQPFHFVRVFKHSPDGRFEKLLLCRQSARSCHAEVEAPDALTHPCCGTRDFKSVYDEVRNIAAMTSVVL